MNSRSKINDSVLFGQHYTATRQLSLSMILIVRIRMRGSFPRRQVTMMPSLTVTAAPLLDKYTTVQSAAGKSQVQADYAETDREQCGTAATARPMGTAPKGCRGESIGGIGGEWSSTKGSGKTFTDDLGHRCFSNTGTCVTDAINGTCSNSHQKWFSNIGTCVTDAFNGTCSNRHQKST